jgi:hypothetical protein
MTTDLAPRVLSADRASGGVIITFDDGKCAVYSASLLHATLGQAELIPDESLNDSES